MLSGGLQFAVGIEMTKGNNPCTALVTTNIVVGLATMATSTIRYFHPVKQDKLTLVPVSIPNGNTLCLGVYARLKLN